MGPDELPIKLHAVSNAEFAPPNATDVVNEAAKRSLAEGEVVARRLGLDRRGFFRTLSGAALCLSTLNACSKEKARSTGQPAPGGTFELPASSTTEAAAAREALTGQEFIFDVQTHLLPYDLTRSSPNFGAGFPQASCGERDARACFDVAHFLDAVFLQSDTSAIVISALPIYGETNPLTTEAMEQTRAIAQQLCDDDRVLLQAQAAPTLGALPAALESMNRTRAQFKVSSWKTYTSGPTPWRFDDRDRSAPQVGQRFLEHVAAGGPRIVAVHKGFGGSVTSPADIGPAAAMNPNIAFLIYHSGYDSVAEGPFDAAKPNAGIDRLVKSLADAGVRPGANVYAELGSTWRAVMSDPTQAAHVLGKLLVAVGDDNVLWGTDSIWYGSPQDQIQAFRAFQITAEFQERFGYPQLTPARKAKILGLNAARLFGIDPKHVPCTYTRDELQQARETRRIRFDTFGPTTRRELAQLVRRLGPIL